MKLIVHPLHPQPRLIKQAVDVLLNDGVIIYPTDTTFSFGCSITSKKAMAQIYQLKKINRKSPLTFIGADLSQVQEYIKPLSNVQYRSLKKILPASITFIFPASKKVPEVMLSPRKTIGFRIPKANIAVELCKELGMPILSSSIPVDDEPEDELYHNVHYFEEKYKKTVQAIIACDPFLKENSAMIDYTQSPPRIIREGSVDLKSMGLFTLSD